MPTIQSSRRTFLEAVSATLGLSLAAEWTKQTTFLLADEPATKEVGEGSVAAAPSNRVRIGVMGVNSRGTALAQSLMKLPGVEIAAIADVDQRALDRVVALVAAEQNQAPTGVKDFRKILDDKSIDVLVCAAPNHWHAPATILATASGKHVYVEKPCSHNPREGELAVESARKHQRIVQMGSQRRSWPAIREAIARLHAGDLGRVLYARTWYNNRRPSVGQGQVVTFPSWLGWELWQGPAPERPYKDNLVHYNWHWHWHWGNGELGNNGIHSLDVARWGLGVEFPTRVTSAGTKVRHDDDQETPDTHVVTFEFPGGRSATWEGLSWSPYGPGGNGFGMSFHGEKGTMLIEDSSYRIFDEKNKEIEKQAGVGGEGIHLANFLESVRTGKLPQADIAEGHRSTLLCHLGNISHRVGRPLTIDPANGHIMNDPEAVKLWSREYRAGWEPKV